MQQGLRKMASWTEVFDTEEVLYAARRAVTAVTMLFGVVVAATIGVMAVATAGRLSSGMAILLIVAVWIAAGLWSAARLRALRRIAWCVRLSEHEIVAYDHARRKTALRWKDVRRIDWHDNRMIISGDVRCSIEVPEHFTQYSRMSHIIYDLAERHNIAILVEGEPLPVLDVYELYSFLRELSIVPDERDSGDVTTR